MVLKKCGGGGSALSRITQISFIHLLLRVIYDVDLCPHLRNRHHVKQTVINSHLALSCRTQTDTVSQPSSSAV